MRVSLTCNTPAVRLEIISLLNKLAPLMSGDTELPSVSNRMSLAH